MQLPSIYLQIPHYNNSSFLKECLHSVCEIDYPHLKIKLIDDCSQDDTVEVLNSLEHNKEIEFITNTSRLGRVKNYHYAFSLHGNANWFINLDSDDYYIDNSWLKKSMEITSLHPEDKIVHIQSNFIARIGIKDIKPVKIYDNGFYLISGFDYIKLCIQQYGFSHLSSIFNIPLADKYGAYTDDCMHTDFLTAARIAIQGNILVGSKEIGVWRKHDGNQSNNRYSDEEHSKNQLAYYRFFEWCEDYLSYIELKTLIEVFENREFDRKLVSTIQKRNISEIGKFLVSEKPNPLKIITRLGKVFVSDIDSENIFNIGHGVIARVLSVLITLTTLPLILKFLGIVDYSWIGIYTTIASAIYIFDFGLTNIIAKEIVQNTSQSTEKRKTIIASQEIVYLVLGLCIFALLYFSSNWLNQYWLFKTDQIIKNENILRLIAFAIIAQWPHSFYTGVLFGLNKQTLSNYTQLGLTLLKNIGVIGLFQYMSPSIELFFYWNILISLITIFLQKFFIYRETNFINPMLHFSWNYINQLKKLALGISIISLFGFIYSDVNNFLLARWLTKPEFAYYAILFNVIIAYMMYCSTIKSALFPAISKNILPESIDSIQTNYIKHFQIISLTLIPLTIFLFIFRTDILTLWLQDVHLTSHLYTSFGWIVIGSLCNALMIIPWSYLIAMSKTKFLIFITGALAFVSIPALYILIKLFQFEGASLYWLFINALPLPFVLHYFNKKIKLRTYPQILHTILLPFFIALFFILFSKYIADLAELSILVKMLTGILFLSLNYLCILFTKHFIIKHNI
jgi:O-antigen/teichoic acid export membrane protein